MPNHFRAIGATTFLSPIPAVMLSCRGTEPGFDRDNLITVAWAGVINSAPPMVSVSLRPSRHSYAQIRAIRRILPEPDRPAALPRGGFLRRQKRAGRR